MLKGAVQALKQQKYSINNIVFIKNGHNINNNGTIKTKHIHEHFNARRYRPWNVLFIQFVFFFS